VPFWSPLAGAITATVAVAVIAAGLLYLLRRRSITTLLTATVLAAIAALTTGVLASTAAALQGQQLRDLLTSMSVAALLSVVIGIGLAKLIMVASVELRRAVRLLGHHQRVPLPDSPTAELRGLAEELAATQQRLAEARAGEIAAEKSRRQLLTWIGHDLRTPLARLRAMAEGLEDDVVQSREIHRYHRAIRLHVDRLTGLVDDVFEVSTIDAGAAKPVLVPIALDDLISDMLATAEPVARARQIGLTGDAPRALTIATDPRLLNRVLDNLVFNALRETAPGGSVTVTATDHTEAVWLEVSDTCGGIDAQALPRVFDPGFRLETNRPGDGRGGLGLTIARGFVIALGGELTVRNTEDGCAFRAVLPKQAPGVSTKTRGLTTDE
jgi:signal transduction histidine kinase